jgi:hypothetical protein
MRCTRCRATKSRDHYKMCSRCRKQMRHQYHKYRRPKELVPNEQKDPHRLWSEEQGRLKEQGLKICPRCRRTLARTEFGSSSQCKQCRADRRSELHAWNNELKLTQGCTDCDESFSDHPERLHWDHLPGVDKRAGISEMINRLNSKQDILKEMEKCEVVCWSCHFRRGQERGQIGKPYVQKTPKWLWGQTVYDGNGSPVEQYNEQGDLMPIAA